MTDHVSDEFRRDAINAVNAVRMAVTAVNAAGNRYEASARGDRQIVTMTSGQCTMVYDRSKTTLALRMNPNEALAPGFVQTTVLFPRDSFPGSELFDRSNHDMAFNPEGYARLFADLVGELDVSSLVMENVLQQEEYARIVATTNVDVMSVRDRVDLAARALDCVLGGRYTSLVRIPALGSPGTVRIRDLEDKIYGDPKDASKQNNANYFRFADFIRSELSIYPSTLMFTRREGLAELVAEPLQYAIGITPPEGRSAIYADALRMVSE